MAAHRAAGCVVFVPMTPDHGSDQGPAGFDSLLRKHRRATGLTQVELAARARVGVRTVRDLERGRSVRPQRTTVELLASALGLTDPDRSAFVAAARRQGAPGTESAAPVPGSPLPPDGRYQQPRLGLPAPAELIGRDRDVTELAGMLTGADGPVPAVVSLVGLAGVGKSALALTVGQRVANQHRGGIAGIVVTELSTESDVLSAVATVFGVGRAQDLASRLVGAPALLLVDAVERSPNAVAEALHRLTVSVPTLHILTTGRHPVGLPGERVWPVSPLEVPPADAPAELSEAAGYPAVALFLARLRQVRRDPLHPDEVGALVGLVRRLGGLPLAIELAAARGRILDLNEILDRYGDRLLDLVGPPTTRQAVGVTLRDAVAASYRLLDPGERAALRRLSAFRNRWSVELAEAMLVEESGRAGPRTGLDAVPLLDRLLALGLLSARGPGPFRFRLLDVVRDFAAERATVNGELTEIRRRHAVLFAQLAQRTAVELAGSRLPAAVRRLDEVSSDLWAALAHAATDDPHTALRLAASLPRWWRFRGRDVAGRQWLRRLLDDPRTADADPLYRAWAQVGAAQLAQEHADGPQELPAAQAALATFQQQGHVAGELAAHSVLCGLWVAVGGHDEARQHGEAVLALASRTGRIRDMAVAQNNLTWHDIRVGELRAARRRLATVDRLGAQCGEERLRALARANLAEVARLEGRYAEAVEQARRAMSALADLGDPSHHRRILGTVGLALAEQGHLDEAGAVLDELRARSKPGDGGPGELGTHDTDQRDAGVCALIEAILALRRGDREWAAEWFAAAAQAYAGDRDLRDVAEALVGLVASTDDPQARAAARVRLDQVVREGGITLLPRERKLIGITGPAVPAQRRSGSVQRQR